LSRKLKPEPRLSVAKKQAPNWQRQRTISLFIWIIIPLIIALTVGLVGYWAYDNYVAAWQRPVAKVNETTLDMSYFVKMLRLYSVLSGEPVDPNVFPNQVLISIENNELIKQAAPNFDIQVSSEELTEVIDNSLLSAAEIAGNTTLTQTESDARYQRWLDLIKLSDDEYRQFIETELTQQKLFEYFKENNIPEADEQVHLHLILVDETKIEGNVTVEEKASELSTELQTGGNFTAIAVEYSSLEGSVASGGDVGWVPRGIYPSQVDDVVFGVQLGIDPSEVEEVVPALQIGNITNPIFTSQGYYIAKISEKAESRPLDSAQRDFLAGREYQDWFQQTREASIIEEYLDQDMVDWAISHMS
jgi:parvulin-like peptidyl-prolyl isomerase